MRSCYFWASGVIFNLSRVNRYLSWYYYFAFSICDKRFTGKPIVYQLGALVRTPDIYYDFHFQITYICEYFIATVNVKREETCLSEEATTEDLLSPQPATQRGDNGINRLRGDPCPAMAWQLIDLYFWDIWNLWLLKNKPTTKNFSFFAYVGSGIFFQIWVGPLLTTFTTTEKELQNIQ